MNQISSFNQQPRRSRFLSEEEVATSTGEGVQRSQQHLNDFSFSDNEEEEEVEEYANVSAERDVENIQNMDEEDSHAEESGDEISMEALEEEIGLHETMLESLHSKSVKLQVDIDKERATLEKHKANTAAFIAKQSQLRTSRETNVVLMKNVTITLNKCIQRLRKKLNEKDPSIGMDRSLSNTSFSEAISDQSQNNDNNLELDPDELMIKGDETMIIKEANDLLSSSSNVIVPDGSNPHIDTPTISDVPTQDSEQYEPLSITFPIKSNCQKERIWSQNHPDNCGIFQQKSFIQDPIFPLHTQISSTSILEQMMLVNHAEIRAQRNASNGSTADDGDEEQRIWSEIQGTCLDVYSACQYDPYLLNAYSKSQQNKSNDERNSSQVENVAGKSFESNDKKQCIIDPMQILCRYELTGTCFDKSCPYQHLRTQRDTAGQTVLEGYSKLPKEVNLPELQLPLSPGMNNISADDDLNEEDTSHPNKGRTTSLSSSNNHPPNGIDISDRKDPSIRENQLKRTLEVGTDQINDPDDDPVHVSQQRKRIRTTDGETLHDETNETSKTSNGLYDSLEENVSDQAVDHETKSDIAGTSSVSSKGLTSNSNTYQEAPTAVVPTSSEVVDEDLPDAPPVEENINSDSKQTYASDARDETTLTPDEDLLVKTKDLSNNAPPVETDFALELDFIELASMHGESDHDSEEEQEEMSSILEELKESSEKESLLIQQNVRESHGAAAPNDDAVSDVPQRPGRLSDLLIKFGFRFNGGEHEMMYQSNSLGMTVVESYDSYPFTKISEKMNAIQSLRFVVALNKAVRLCIHAGRYDLSRSLLSGSRKYFDQVRGEMDESSINYRFHIIMANLIDDMSRVVQGAFCGNGSQSFHFGFHVQLCLSVIAQFIRGFIRMLRKATRQPDEVDNYFDQVAFSVSYQRYREFYDGALEITTTIIPETPSQDDTTARHAAKRFGFPDFMIPLEEDYTNLLNCAAEERMKKLFRCINTGQKIAQYFATSIHSQEQPISAQLILDEMLHPLAKAIQNHISRCRNSVTEEAIDESLHQQYSCGLPSQTLLFAVYGPSIFTAIAGLVREIKETSTRSGMDPRTHGLLIAVKKLLIQIVHDLDLSAMVIGDNLEGQLLLCPIFSLVVTIFISLEQYGKAQVLLENVIHMAHSSHTTQNYSLYSEQFWSQLIALQMCFPSEHYCTIKSQGKKSERRIDSSLEGGKTILPAGIKTMLSLPIQYEININKLSMHGDSTLVGNCFYQLPKNDQRKLGDNLRSIQIAVNEISNCCHDCDKKKKKNHIAINLNDLEQKVTDIELPKVQLMSQFPRSILLVKSLTSLSLKGCGLDSLPLTFGIHLECLETLDLSNNNMKELFSAIFQLKRLRVLDVSQNRLHYLPSDIRHLQNLSKISARNNEIDSISNLSECRNLASIDMRDNNIKDYPSDLPLKLPKLSKLLLSGNPMLSS